MTLVQFISLLMCIAGLAGDIAWLVKNKNVSKLAIPEMTLFIHAIIFYASIALDKNLLPDEYTVWSSALRLHSYMTISLMIFYRLLSGRIKR